MNAEESHSGEPDIYKQMIQHMKGGGRLSEMGIWSVLEEKSSPDTQDSRQECLDELRKIPKQNIGIDDRKIQKFMKKTKLGACEYFVINTADAPKELVRALEKRDSTFGAYLPRLNAVILLADRILGSNISTIDKEGILVHEFAHASTSTEGGFQQAGDTTIEHEKGGSFFEEGFADLIQREYIAANGKISDTEASASGNNITMNSVLRIDMSQTTENLYLDAKRLTPLYPPSIYAGFGLELLCTAIPNLRKMLIQSRKDSRVFPQVLALIDSRYPGLSDQLYRLRYNLEDFKCGSRLVVRAIYGTDEITTNEKYEPVIHQAKKTRGLLKKLFS